MDKRSDTATIGLTEHVLRPRGSLWRGWIALMVLIVGFGVWSTTTQIAGAIILSGHFEIESRRQIVQHPDGGVVADILVREGDMVEVGDLLVRLDGTLMQFELDTVSGQLVEIQARRARLEAERDGLQTMKLPHHLATLTESDPAATEQVEGQLGLFKSRAETFANTVNQLDRRKVQTHTQIAGIKAQLLATGDQLLLVAEETADQESLFERQLVQVGRLRTLRREQAVLIGRQGELSAELALAEGRVTEIDLQILGLQAARREEASSQLRDIGALELELAQRHRALVEQMLNLDIRAPTSGTMLELKVTTLRSVVRPAEAVAYIVPQDRPLILSVQVPPVHVDEIWAGQAVRLDFPGFSSRNLPDLNGVVALVSADVLIDPATYVKYYRAEITISPEEADRLGQQLLPGMPVEAFIQTQQRTPLAYLIKPFADYFMRAFRET